MPKNQSHLPFEMQNRGVVYKQTTPEEQAKIDAAEKECCEAICCPCSKICCCTIKEVKCRSSKCEIKCWHALACCLLSACVIGGIDSCTGCFGVIGSLCTSSAIDPTTLAPFITKSTSAVAQTTLTTLEQVATTQPLVTASIFA